MAKAHVDGAAHELETRHAQPLSFKEVTDAIHLGFRFRRQTNHSIAFVDRVSPAVAGKEPPDIVEQVLGLGEEFAMSRVTARVPIAEILPLTTGSPMKYFAFRR